MAGDEQAEDFPVEEPEEAAGGESAEGEAPLEEDILVVLPEEESGTGGMDSFFDEAEAAVEAESAGVPAVEAEPGEEPVLEAEPAEAPAAEEAPAEEVVVEAGPLPVTILDLYADGLPAVDPQVRDYLGQGYLFYIVNASAVPSAAGDDLVPLVDLDADVRAQGGQLVLCNLQDAVKTAIHEAGLYDSLSLTEAEEEAVDWTRKIVMENTGSDIELSRVPLGTEGVAEEEAAVPPPEMEALVTQEVPREETDEVVDLTEDAIVQEAPLEPEVSPEMVTQEIPEEEFEAYAAETTAEAPVHEDVCPEPEPAVASFEPVGPRVGPTRIRPRARRPILLLVLLMGTVALVFTQFDFAPKILQVLGVTEGPGPVAIAPTTDGGEAPPPTPEGNGETPVTPEGPTERTPPGRTPAVPDDPETESERYKEVLTFSLTDLIERR